MAAQRPSENGGKGNRGLRRTALSTSGCMLAGSRVTRWALDASMLSFAAGAGPCEPAHKSSISFYHCVTGPSCPSRGALSCFFTNNPSRPSMLPPGHGRPDWLAFRVMCPLTTRDPWTARAPTLPAATHPTPIGPGRVDSGEFQDSRLPVALLGK